MPKTEMRIHGNVVAIQSLPPFDWFKQWLQMMLRVDEDFTGKVIRVASPPIEGKIKYWFHFPIPTPSMLDGVKPTLNKIFIDYTVDNTNADVYIDEVHIYDGKFHLCCGSGGKPIFSNPTDFKHSEDNWVITSKPTIQYGLGISIQVAFASPKASGNERSIKFHSAGAEFETP